MAYFQCESRDDPGEIKLASTDRIFITIRSNKEGRKGKESWEC